jgi:excisionase family DNA binding protein
MRRSSATKRPVLEILGRPEGGPGETRPCVSPAGEAQARHEVLTSLHQLIDALTARDGEPRDRVPAELGRDLPLLLNAVATGRLLSISRAKVLDLAASGDIPSVRIGGSVRIPRDALMAWIDEQTKAPDWLQARGLPRWPNAKRNLEP